MKANSAKHDFTSVNEHNIAMTANNELAGNPPVLGVPAKNTPMGINELHPRLPDSGSGYQALPGYLVTKYVKVINDILHDICEKRNTTIDFKYWKSITRQLFSVSDPSTAQVIPAKAGYGKSTWLLTLMIFFRKLEVEAPDEARSLGGCCVVLQKVETLNALADQLEQYADLLHLGSGTEMVMIQGWTPSGAAHGFCQNTDVNSFKDCQKKSCPFADSCKMLRFADDAGRAPLIGITQARFNLLRSGGDLNSILIRKLDDGTEVYRRFLIFDEKFDLAEIHDFSRDTLVKATSELEELLKKRKASDRMVQFAENGLDYAIRSPFQDLRKLKTSYSENPYTLEPIPPPIAGFCTALDVSKSFYHEDALEKFSNFVSMLFERYTKCLTPAVRECIRVWDDLLNKDAQLLYTVDQGFTLHDITPANLRFGNCLTVVFDATAEVDPDYRNLSDAQFLQSKMAKPYEKVNVYVYTDDAFRVSRSAFQSNWKLPVICREVSEIIRKNEGAFFITTYQRYAGAIYNELEKLLSPSDLNRIATVKNRSDEAILPYFGGTNGENGFNHCKHVIIIGYPRLPPATYLTNTCAVFGSDVIRKELDVCNGETPASRKMESLELPSVKEYICGHLTARLEQEIFRCQIRNYAYEGDTKIYLFYPPNDVLDALLNRFPSAEKVEIHEPPANLENIKRGARSFHGLPTAFKRLTDFVESWDGEPILISEIKVHLDISDSVWHDIMQSMEWKEYLKGCGIVTSGNGRYRKWKKERNNAVA